MRSNGVVQDLRAPLEDGEPIQILTDARQGRPGRALRAAPLERAPARRGRPPALPGREDRDRPADRATASTTTSTSPSRSPRPTSSGSRRRSGASSPRAASGAARRRPPTRRARGSGPRASRTRSSSSTRPRARSASTRSPHGGGEFTDLCRGPHLQNSAPIKAFKLTGLAGAYWRGDEQQQAADADLRHRLLLAGRPRRAPRAARGGARARPPPARRAARPLPLLRHLARLAVLAPEGDGDLERARGPAPPRGSRARLRRGADAADLRQGALGDLGPLGEVPRAHVHVPSPRTASSGSSR